MNTGSISLGRLVGAAVRIHWSALVVAALLAASMARGVGFALAIVGVAIFFASILVHELGHALVARRFDIPTSAIELWGLGGFARLEREARTPKAEGWIAAAGPLASFALGGVAIAVAVLGHRAGLGDHLVALAGWTGLINVVLGLFNLLPGAPLDGGRIVRAVRWHQHGQRYRAMREAGAGRPRHRLGPRRRRPGDDAQRSAGDLDPAHRRVRGRQRPGRDQPLRGRRAPGRREGRRADVVRHRRDRQSRWTPTR